MATVGVKGLMATVSSHTNKLASTSVVSHTVLLCCRSGWSSFSPLLLYQFSLLLVFILSVVDLFWSSVNRYDLSATWSDTDTFTPAVAEPVEFVLSRCPCQLTDSMVLLLIFCFISSEDHEVSCLPRTIEIVYDDWMMAHWSSYCRLIQGNCHCKSNAIEEFNVD